MTLEPTPERLREYLRGFSQLTIAVWGVLVADEFITGEIARVSREAPVLILKRRTRTLAPGGGANAAVNLAALGVRVKLVGMVGRDEPGRGLLEIFRGHGIDVSGVLTLPERLTPTKTRILAHHAHTVPQQVVRVDQEPAGLAEGEAASLERRLNRLALEAARGAAALLISDYGYGAVTPAGAAGVRRQLKRPALTTVDARFQIAAYRGMTAATPNESELEAALGVAIQGSVPRLEAAGRKLRRRLEAGQLLVTRGSDGMALFERGRPTRYLPVHGSRQALDVTGAGDTVIAAFTAALAAGASGPDAAALANCAGGLVVMKPGTATVTARELDADLADYHP